MIPLDLRVLTDVATVVDLADYALETYVDTELAKKVDKVTGKALSTNDYTNTDKQSVEKIPTIEQDILDLESDKVDKVAGKGLSTNDYTTTEKNKLAGIASGAEVNVQSDWAQEVNTADDYIKNKPAIPTKISDLTNDTGYITGYTETDPIFTAWNKSTGISITKSQVSDLLEATQALSGLMSATDKQRLDVLHSLLEEDTENNVVDSINEVLAIFNNYPEGADLVTALAGKVDKVTGKGLSENDLTDILKSNYDTAYSWGDHAVEGYLKSITKAMVEAVLTGTITSHDHDGTYEHVFTKNTAFNKNFGTSAGTVAQGNHLHTGVYEPANANIQAHISSTSNPHGVTKAQIGLGNVDNTSDLSKPISTAQQTALDNKVDKTSIVDNLTTNDATKPLSAKQGKALQDNKVDKTLTILGLDLQNNISISEFRTALGNATQSVAGLLSAEDKTHLDVLVALLETSDDNNVVDTIGEILAIFQNYPEGADLVTALAGKVDKVSGKGLSTNDFTNNDKNKLDGIEAGAEVNPYSKTQLDNMFGDKVDKNANITAGTSPKITYDAKGLVTGGEALAASDIPNLNASKINAGTFDAARIPNLAPTKITQNASNRFVTDVEKAYWDGKVDADGLEWSNILNKPTLATVATSGSYADLSNKPTIPDTSGLLPKSGGTLENYNEKLTTLSTSNGAINLSLGNVFVQTPSANITYSITNAVSGVAHSFTLIVNMGATVRTLTFPASVKWQGGEIPDMTTPSKTYVLTFLTVDGGTNWLGMFGGDF